MTQIFLANCTQQNQQINVRMPEGRKPISMTIPMGQQRIFGDLSPPELGALEEQLGPYGLFSVDAIKRADKKITYVFAVGRAVKSDEMRSAIDRNQGILRDEGQERRQNAAIAAGLAMDTDQTPLNKMELSVEEEATTPHFSSDSEKQVGEGYRIDNTVVTNENTKIGARNAGKKNK